MLYNLLGVLRAIQLLMDMGTYRVCRSGKTAPPPEGTRHLDALDVTAGGVVERLPDRDPEALRAWEEAGLVPGARITVVASACDGVTVLLEDGQMLLLDPAQASGIVVRG